METLLRLVENPVFVWLVALAFSCGSFVLQQYIKSKFKKW